MTTIKTYTGHIFNYEKPQFYIEDIAVGLSRENRFGNQSHIPYSVAKHSIIGSYLIEKKYKLAFLLHDAAEAYVRDLPTPLKKLCPDYTRIEKFIQAQIYIQYAIRLSDEAKVRIKEVDNIMYEWERFYCFSERPAGGQYYTELLKLSRRFRGTPREFIHLFSRYSKY